MIICSHCQSETPKVRGNQRYCPGCREEANRAKRLEWSRNNPEKNKANAKARFSAWAAKNRERRSQADKAYRAANAERIRATRSDPAYKARVNAQRREKYCSCKNRRVHARIASSIRLALKGSKAGRSWESLVGYTLADLVRHLERQFLPGMTWENMGQWHIDHIRPKSGFDQTDPVQFRECWGLANLRPLWAPANQAKAAKREHLL